MKEKGIATAVVAAVVVVIVAVAGIGAYVMLKGPEGGVLPGGGEGEGQPGVEEGETLWETKFSFVEGDNESWTVYARQMGQEVLSPSWFRFDYLSEGPSLRCRQFESLESARNDINPLGEAVVDYVGATPTPYSFAFGEGTASVDMSQVAIWNLPPEGYVIYKYETTGEKIWTFEGIRISGEVGNEIGLDPEVFQLPDGSYRMYLGDSEHETKGQVVASSPDGLAWTVEPWREESITWAPTVIELPDGQYRIYWDYWTAVSSDGHNWENKTAFTLSNEYFYGCGVPSAIILPDGTYRMYYDREEGPGAYGGIGERVWRIYSAHSSDGLAWEPDPGIRIDGAEAVDRGHASSCDVYIREDGKYEMVYISGGAEIYRAVSDDGLNWTRMGYTGIQGLDPIINIFPDGTIRMYYATTAAEWFPPSDKPPGVYSAIRGAV